MTGRAAAIALALPLLLTACGGSGEGTSISLNATGEDGNTLFATDANGHMQLKAPGVDIGVNLPRIHLDADNFDMDGMKLYPGSTVRDVNLNAEDHAGDDDKGHDDKGHVAIAFDAPAPLATVKSWYADNLARNGFKVTAKGNGFAGTTSDGDPFALTLEANGGAATSGMMTVGS